MGRIKLFKIFIYYYCLVQIRRNLEGADVFVDVGSFFIEN